jgi:hypothetical protein
MYEYNTIWHKGLNNNASTAIFLLLRNVYNRYMKITKNNSTFLSSLALSNQAAQDFLELA